MSALIRFSTGPTRYKARMFEQGSRKQECRICHNRRYGILVRFVEPKKFESGICHECIARIAFDMPLAKEVQAEQIIVAPAKKPAAGKKKKLFKKLKGQHNVRKPETQNQAGDGGQCPDQQDQTVS